MSRLFTLANFWPEVAELPSCSGRPAMENIRDTVKPWAIGIALGLDATSSRLPRPYAAARLPGRPGQLVELPLLASNVIEPGDATSAIRYVLAQPGM